MQTKSWRAFFSSKSRRVLIGCISMALVLTAAIGGSLAWLMDETNQVVNTFTYGDVAITLEETKTNENGEPVDATGAVIPDGSTTQPVKTTTGNEYKMVPGKTFLKDPAITVEQGSESCWVFVELVENGSATVDGTAYNFDNYLTYEMADGWTALPNANGVYYRLAETDPDADQVFPVLKGNQIAVQGAVTKDMLHALDAAGAEDVKLAITGYAVQYLGFEVENNDTAAAAQKAWEAAKPQP